MSMLSCAGFRGACLVLLLSLPDMALLAATAPIQFRDEAEARGVRDLAINSTGPTFGDYDGDGDLDIFVPVEDLAPGLADRLFENDGAGRFTDVAAARGVQNPGGMSRGAVFCDLDNDGDLGVHDFSHGHPLYNPNPDRGCFRGASCEKQEQK
jgi:hypothetical protein